MLGYMCRGAMSCCLLKYCCIVLTNLSPGISGVGRSPLAAVLCHVLSEQNSALVTLTLELSPPQLGGPATSPQPGQPGGQTGGQTGG